MESIGTSTSLSVLAASLARQTDVESATSVTMLKKTLDTQQSQVAQLLAPITGQLDMLA